jgi:hypothetical protein
MIGSHGVLFDPENGGSAIFRNMHKRRRMPDYTRLQEIIFFTSSVRERFSAALNFQKKPEGRGFDFR